MHTKKRWNIYTNNILLWVVIVKWDTSDNIRQRTSAATQCLSLQDSIHHWDFGASMPDVFAILANAKTSDVHCCLIIAPIVQEDQGKEERRANVCPRAWSAYLSIFTAFYCLKFMTIFNYIQPVCFTSLLCQVDRQQRQFRRGVVSFSIIVLS